MITINEYKMFDKKVSNNDIAEGLEYRLENFGLENYKDWFYGTNDWEIKDSLHGTVTELYLTN